MTTGCARKADLEPAIIDVWNGYRFTAWHSVLRTVFGISIEGYMTDYKLAKSALFWPLS